MSLNGSCLTQLKTVPLTKLNTHFPILSRALPPPHPMLCCVVYTRTLHFRDGRDITRQLNWPAPNFSVHSALTDDRFDHYRKREKERRVSLSLDGAIFVGFVTAAAAAFLLLTLGRFSQTWESESIGNRLGIDSL